MKRSTRFFSLALALIMMLAFVPAATAITGAADEFEIRNGILVRYNGTKTEVIIPGGIDTIGIEAFQDNTLVTSVVIPDGVRNIGRNAFTRCSSLTSVAMPNSVRTIGHSAFEMSGLTSVVIPDNVTSIGTRAFADCEDLTSIILSKNIKSINDGTFSGTGLTSVVIPAGVTSIGNEAFRNSRELESVVIPYNAETIGSFAFSLTAITSVVIPDSVTNVGHAAFMACTSLTSAVLPNNLKVIESDMFSGCISLRSVFIPSSVTSIKERVFDGCENLSIYGEAGSYAETYARSNRIRFVTAIPSSQRVVIDGREIAFAAYNIEGSNFVTIRNLAYILNGTSKQFEIGWDGVNNAISLTSGQPYTPRGDEMEMQANRQNKIPVPTSSAIYLNGGQAQFTAYFIEGSNYFRLRDVMQAFNVYVGWDGETNTITLDTSRGYGEEHATTAEFIVSAFEHEVFELINIERINHGLQPLIWDDALADVARARSADMANRDYFDHICPDGINFYERIHSAGIFYWICAENIAAGQITPEEVVDAWMNSPVHRDNILYPDFTHTGVGVYLGGKYEYYWTQHFKG